jgi:hypothetical protein
VRLFGLLAVGMLAAATALASGSATPGLVPFLDGFEKLQVANESGPVTNLKLSSGHLECTLVSGRAAYVKAGDEVVGIYFEGSGTMEYTSVDPVEAPVVTYVAKKSTSLSPEKTDKGLRIKDKFGKLLWLAAGEKAPELTGLGPAPLTASFRAHMEKFGRRRGTPRSFGFALQKFNAPSASYIWVEMEGGAEDLVYERDGMWNPEERLAFLHGPSSHESKVQDMLFGATLSGQKIGWDRRDPPQPRFVLTDVDLEVKASVNKDVKLSVVETLVPQKASMSVFRFDLDQTVYTTFGAHLATRTEKVAKITDEQGRPLGFWHDHGELLVQTAEPVPADRPVRLRFELEGDFLVQEGGSDFWELGVWSWFPQPELCEQFYKFHAVVHVKKPFVPFASGRTIRRVQEGDENVLETKVDDPVQFAVILAGKYDFNDDVRDGVTIRVATYALRNDRAVKQLTDLASTIIGFYKEFLGPFPFPEFNIIEIDDYGFGQAPPGVMFITKEAFNPTGGTEENQLYSGGVNERFAHEIAHQYWGQTVKMPSHEEQWLTESFAEYSAALFIKAAKGDAHYKSLVGHWKGNSRFALDKAPIPLANRVYVANDATSQYAIRTGLLYDKGPLLLAALHRELGDEAFYTFFKSYQKSFRWKFGSTKTIAGLLQFMTKKDYGPFFEANYWGTGLPKD